MRLTASVTRENNWYVASCLEVEVTSQGETEEQALNNLREALELYYEDKFNNPPTIFLDTVSGDFSNSTTVTMDSEYNFWLNKEDDIYDQLYQDQIKSVEMNDIGLVSKDELHRLVDQLNEKDYKTAFDFMQFLVNRSAIQEAWRQIEAAEPDDEHLTVEELQRLNSNEGVVTWEKAKRELGIKIDLP